MNFHSDQPTHLKAASMLDKKRAEYDGMLVCEICCEEYDQEKIQPVVLPCGHTFCSLCWKDFRKACPNCREKFEESQVKKNYFIFNLMEAQKRFSVNRNEKCSAHRREIDRFCKSCRKLMCSVCHCEHLGSALIISDVNLREEIEGIEKFMMKIKTQKQVVKDKITARFQEQIEQIEKEETNSKDRIEVYLKEQSQQIESDRKELIHEAEESARQKIEAIEKEKLELIEKANKEAEEMMKNAEKTYKSSKANIVGHMTRFKQIIESQNQKLQKKLEISTELEDFKKDTLDQCVILYHLWESQKSQLEEISQLYESPEELGFSEKFTQQQNQGLKYLQDELASPKADKFQKPLAYQKHNYKKASRKQDCAQQ